MTTKLEPGTIFQTPTGWTCDAHRGGEIVARFYGEDCADRARKWTVQCAAADAALIARAPDLLAENAKLLEILRETLRVLVTPDGVPDANKGRTKEQHSALLNARAALAEGGGK